MSDSVSSSEKEAAKWKLKFTKCNETVIKMAEQVHSCTAIQLKTTSLLNSLNIVCFCTFQQQVQAEKSILNQKQKNKKLEELCRALQQERNELNSKLKELTTKEVCLCVSNGFICCVLYRIVYVLGVFQRGSCLCYFSYNNVITAVDCTYVLCCFQGNGGNEQSRSLEDSLD